jgi:heme-degrading monooxygenase HmoA
MKYAVIFSSTLKDLKNENYHATAERMEVLVRNMPGFLGMESKRDSQGQGVTISYWKSLEDIQRWKEHPEHLTAQSRGKSEWYSSFKTEIKEVP